MLQINHNSYFDYNISRFTTHKRCSPFQTFRSVTKYGSLLYFENGDIT